MYGAVFPSPSPLIGWLIGEYGEIQVPKTV
jgi:hypothetical protein